MAGRESKNQHAEASEEEAAQIHALFIAQKGQGWRRIDCDKATMNGAQATETGEAPPTHRDQAAMNGAQLSGIPFETSLSISSEIHEWAACHSPRVSWRLWRR